MRNEKMKDFSRVRSGTARYGWFPLFYFAVMAVLLACVCAVPTPRAEAITLQCGNPCIGGEDPFNSPDSGYSPDCSPILIDVSGDGFQLTNAQNGVTFDIRGTGMPLKISWTASGSKNAFLVLDRNGNGVIDNGKEMFGNFTAQPLSPHPNGFLALAEFDKPEHGGNGDGVIDSNDAIFSSLRLWVDANHDGVSQPGELFKPSDLGVSSISLNYKEARRTDQYGNMFRFRARVNMMPGQQADSSAGPMAYDVFLFSQ